MEKGQAAHSSILGLSLVAQVVKNPPAVLETWVRKIARRGHSNPLQYSCLEDPHGQKSLAGSMGVTKCLTRLSDSTAANDQHAHPVTRVREPLKVSVKEQHGPVGLRICHSSAKNN